MQFTSKKWKSARYVIEPRDVLITSGKPVQKIVGLAAVFRNHAFDSNEAAKAMKWTNDQKMLVEASLLLHNDFGRRNSVTQGSIWLLPKGSAVDVNVDISDELEAFSPGLRAEVTERLGLGSAPVHNETPACMHFIVNADGMRQCKREAQVGIYCKQHAKMHDEKLSADDLRELTESELVS